MKKTHRQALRVFCLVICTVCLFSFLGCEETPIKEPEAVKPTVGVLIYLEDDAYVSLVTKSVKEEFGDEVNLIIKYSKNDQFLQNEQIEELLKQNVQALVVNLVETQSAAKVIDVVRPLQIPMVFFNREPDPADIATYDKACFVGTIARDAGKMQGDLIYELWKEHPEFDKNGDGQFQYLMFQGPPDNPEAIARTEYSVRQARERGVLMKQLDRTYMCGWNQTLAQEAMQLALTLHKDTIELVIANNDAMALGVISALSERGYNLEGNVPAKFVPVVGVDALSEAIEAIKKGVMSATVKQDAVGMARAIVALTLNGLRHNDFLKDTEYAWDDTGVSVRIPYIPLLHGDAKK